MNYYIDCPKCEANYPAEYDEGMAVCTNCRTSFSIDVDGPRVWSDEDLALAKDIQQQVKNTEWRI